MSDNVENDRVVDLLTQIRDNQTKTPDFNAGAVVTGALIAAFGFVMALALNSFLSLVFAQIPVGSTGLLGAGIYALIAIILCVGAIFLIAVYLGPRLTKLFERKKHAEKSKTQ